MFFFKQKTAYEMRISDWSSDVCSSDLKAAGVFSLTRTVSDCVGIQRVASGSNGTDDVGRAIDVDCFAQAADVNINGAQFKVGVLAPHAVKQPDRKSVVLGKMVSDRVDLGGRRLLKKKQNNIKELHI